LGSLAMTAAPLIHLRSFATTEPEPQPLADGEPSSHLDIRGAGRDPRHARPDDVDHPGRRQQPAGRRVHRAHRPLRTVTRLVQTCCLLWGVINFATIGGVFASGRG
jgi:hypothetical protein